METKHLYLSSTFLFSCLLVYSSLALPYPCVQCVCVFERKRWWEWTRAGSCPWSASSLCYRIDTQEWGLSPSCTQALGISPHYTVTRGKGGERGSGVWPSMVTHTRNLSSAFNPSKCTLTAVNTHLEQWAAILRRPGSSWGIGALLKGLTSVVVLKVERALVIHSPHRQSLPDLGIEPATFGLQVQLSNH